MSTDHPITPPPELVEQWEAETAHTTKDETWHVAVQAARWGADQELNECCHLLRLQGFDVVDDLRAARRPKPPSLKELALEALDRMDQLPTAEDQRIIRRALEALPE